MARGDPFLSTDVDRWLYSVLSVDPLLREYAPGGFWSSDPPQVTNSPWSASQTYGFGDYANGSDGFPYHSLIDSNIANDPTSSPTEWALAFPCVRWWPQSQGDDLTVQDGMASRAESLPSYIVCMLDRQRGGAIDKVGGTNGHLETGALRIASLLQKRRDTLTLSGRTFQFDSFRRAAYEMVDPKDGDHDVMVGVWIKIYVQ